jgi:hypothetical protein
MVESIHQENVESLRVVVVYKYPVFRDLIVHVLDKADIHVAATIEIEALEATSLETLKPDVVVVYDPEAQALLDEVVSQALLRSRRNESGKVICIGMDNEMIVFAKTIRPDPTVEILISAVLERSPSAAVTTGDQS